MAPFRLAVLNQMVTPGVPVLLVVPLPVAVNPNDAEPVTLNVATAVPEADVLKAALPDAPSVAAPEADTLKAALPVAT